MRDFGGEFRSKVGTLTIEGLSPSGVRLRVPELVLVAGLNLRRYGIAEVRLCCHPLLDPDASMANM